LKPLKGWGNPPVTGVLPIGLEDATKTVQAVLAGGKEYVGVMKLHGEVDFSRVVKVFKEFTGEIFQRPPLRSSVKRRIRTRTIYYASVLEMEGRNVLFKVGCQSGTYIRKLCVPGSTELILYDGGLKRVRELYDKKFNSEFLQNLFTISLSDDFKVVRGKITKLYRVSAPNKLIRITTESGIPIIVTPDHEILMSTHSGPAWIPACNLKVGSFVYSPKRVPVKEYSPYIVDLLDDETCVINEKVRDFCVKEVKNKFGSIRKMNRKTGLDRKIFSKNRGLRIKYVKSLCDWNQVKKFISLIKTEKGRIVKLNSKRVNCDLAYLLGLLAADGCIIWEKGCIRPNRIKFHNSDEKLVKVFTRFYKKIFPGMPLQVKQVKDGLIEVNIQNPILGRIAYSLGIRSPEDAMDLKGIFILSEKLIKGFLKGYFDGDGSCFIKKLGGRTYSSIEFFTGSRLVAKRLYQLLKRLGIRSKVFCKRSGGTFRSRRGFIYVIRIVNPDDKNRFIVEIGANHPRKKKSLQMIREHLNKAGIARNFNYVPLHANQLIKLLLAKNGLKEGNLRLGGNFRRALSFGRPLTWYLLDRVVKSLLNLIGEDDLKRLLSILHSDFYVERVKMVEEVRAEEACVYDLTVENFHNFIPEGVVVVSNCHDIGEVLGVGAHMAELRRTRAGPYTEDENLVKLQDLADAQAYYKEKKDETWLRKVVLPVETAVRLLPKVYIKDSAVEAICYGAHVAVPGISRLDSGLKPGDLTAVMTLKGELVALAKAEMSTEQILEAEKGIALKTERVIMPKGRYPKTW
jgi:tRNA U55 pseudouridine synthase TruB